MFPTPILSHIKQGDYMEVYEPAEDTFLLLDAFEKDVVYLTEVVKPKMCLEIGTGSGCVLTFLSQLLRSHGVCPYCLGIDVNPFAAATTRATLAANNVLNMADVIQCDLVSSLLLSATTDGGPPLMLFDVIIFNPPYVVTESREVGRSDIYASWAGGVDGREVTDKLIPQIPHLLSPHGVFYLVVLPQNKPQTIIDYFLNYYIDTKSSVKFNVEYLLSRKGGRESLSILKIYKTDK